ncbi:hypothetical protein TrST_g12464 [Triparma strigata]|uniref:Protein kinase domain-containing protein n=1 Tax=Triparma strigata TaxID=1606541 RepID=A0A9W7AUD3_9STRA|nr:hypothetical protein TrST_g12464 [Triparma strigata]
MGTCTSAPGADESGKAGKWEPGSIEEKITMEFPDMGKEGKFAESYDLGKVLGQGAFSTVREGTEKGAAKEKWAVKCVTKSALTADDREALLDEIDILRTMKHAGIITLKDHFEEEKFHYLVLESMEGGELFDRIVAKQFYNELDARDCIRTILDALHYIHMNKIAHRDLKPENLLLRSKDNDTDVKIADFGFAKKCSKQKCLKTQCGTPGYVAPEILKGKKYDYAADMWSIGVIMYIIIGGYPPFYEPNQKELFRKIKEGEYEFHPEFWNQVSSDAKDLIKRCLTVNPDERITCAQACTHQWIKKDNRALSSVDLGKNLAEFKRFNAKRKFKSGVHAVIASNKMKSLMSSLKEASEEV